MFLNQVVKNFWLLGFDICFSVSHTDSELLRREHAKSMFHILIICVVMFFFNYEGAVDIQGCNSIITCSQFYP